MGDHGLDAVAILVPVLRRPHRVRPLLDSIEATTPSARVCFIPDPDDDAEKQAIRARGGEILLEMHGGWASKLNAAIDATDEPLIFLGADDLEFRPGWLEQSAAKLAPGIGLVGVNDLIKRRREHTTHFLMTREYSRLPLLDGSSGPVPTCYSHSWADDELIATAKHRGAYAYAGAAKVKHFHPWGGGGTDDEIYELGRARFHRDRRLFEKRSRLWI